MKYSTIKIISGVLGFVGLGLQVANGILGGKMQKMEMQEAFKEFTKQK